MSDARAGGIMTSGHAPVQRLFLVSAATGFAILVFTAISMMQPPARACGALAGNYAPIIAFELARSAADLQGDLRSDCQRMPQ
jgi:hypothetical protein